MENVEVVVDLIANVGLPIALVIAMGWFIWTIYKRSEKREDVLREQVIDSQKVNAEAIHTIALYAERLATIEEDVKEVKHDVNILINK